jgi:threonine dehydratase
VNRRLVDEIVTVSDEEIVEAMAFLFDRLKLVAEPSGAVGVAVLLSGRLDARERSVGIVVSGGNVGAARFAELVSRTLQAAQDDLDQRLLGLATASSRDGRRPSTHAVSSSSIEP